jgi:hypothetical protein
LGFIKVLVAKSDVNGLNERLSGLVEGLLKWQDEKNHFKAKVCFLSILLSFLLSISFFMWLHIWNDLKMKE